MFAGSGETIDEIGKSAIYLLSEPGYAGGDIVIFRSDESNNPLFLAHLLNSTVVRRELRKLGQGQSVVHVYKRDLEQMKLSLPEKAEQQRIVAVLDTWDEYLEKLDRKIALKEQLKKGLMQQLLAGKRRFPEFSGEWHEVQLSKVCQVNPSSVQLPAKFFYIDLESVVKGRLHKELSSLSRNEAPSRAQRILKKSDVLFQTVRPYQKNNYYYDMEGSYVASTGYAQLRAKDSPRFLYHFIHSEGFVRKVMRACTGSSYPAINSSDLAKVRVYFPDYAEQERIEEILTIAEAEINLLRAKRHGVERQKKYLLKNLMTGTIRTPEHLTPMNKETIHA